MSVQVWSPDREGLLKYFQVSSRQYFQEIPHAPGLSEVGPVRHDLFGELDLLLAVAEAQIERLPEHKGDLVGVHRAGPLGPRRGGGDLGEVVHVDVAPHLRVLVAEVQDGAGEFPVARHPGHRVKNCRGPRFP